MADPDANPDANPDPPSPFAVAWRRVIARLRTRTAKQFAVAAVVLAALYLGVRFLGAPAPARFADDVDHFKYGSIGSEHVFGVPVNMWHALPELFADKLPPAGGYASIGMVYEDGHDLPVGTTVRRVMGFDRVWLNCAVCHTGTVRDAPDAKPTVYAGMPANTFDFRAFMRFFLEAAPDRRFTPDRILRQIAVREEAGRGRGYDALDTFLLRFIGIYWFRERTLMVKDRLRIFDEQPEWGPGRVDTFNAAKVLFGFPTDALPAREKVGTADFPSIWNQAAREGMQLHWDGNNTSVAERNRSAALGAGATPPTLEGASMDRIERWIGTLKQPPYPYDVDPALAARGAPIYARLCADCHGASGSDFTGRYVGQVVPIDRIGTDRHRLDSYTLELSANQNTLYAGYEERRFKHFRKTNGYANMPLDGVWLRAPYLHNGSVPTLRLLLEPQENRPAAFYRGNDVYDPAQVGFVFTVADYGPSRRFFRYDVALPGNGNGGHEGAAYGTALTDAEKDALVEHLKTF